MQDHGAAIVMALVLPRIVPVLGEWKTAVVGLCFSVVGLTGYACLGGWVVYVVIVLTVMENIARSAGSAAFAPARCRPRRRVSCRGR